MPQLSRLKIAVWVLSGLALSSCASTNPYNPNQDGCLLASRSALVLASEEPRPGGRLTATFIGNTTVLISDGETQLLIDGFVSRPPSFKDLKPDTALIRSTLDKAGATSVDAVLVGHAHHDHALDAPAIAKDHHALLIGSESVANIGRGQKVPEDLIVIMEGPRHSVKVGEFAITFAKTEHGAYPLHLRWIHLLLCGKIRKPLEVPANFHAFKTGTPYLIHLEHPSGNVLVQTSAGLEPEAVKGLQADTAIVGMGFLGSRNAGFRKRYLKTHIQDVGAKLAVPVHWDNFREPLPENEGDPLPYFKGDRHLNRAMTDLKAVANGNQIYLPAAYERIVLPGK